MSNLVFVSEHNPLEKRCALLPENAAYYQNKLGASVWFEAGMGKHLGYQDQDYIDAGAHPIADMSEVLQSADAVISVAMINGDYAAQLPEGAATISFFDPFNNEQRVQHYLAHGISSISVEMIPRSTRAQKMDALSSQASLAGYVMALKGMLSLPKSLPMMMTPAGTLKPAKVFVIGAGVAGLQAIATAKRMGASVMAYDTRSEVQQQVESLGGKFLKIDLGETGATEQGYAKALSAQQLQKQQDAQASCIKDADLVITTAQLFGRKPPVLIKNDVVKDMRHGAVVVDMAALEGGNVEASVAGEIINYEGVSVIGTGNWASQVALDSTQMYANNIQALLEEVWCTDSSSLQLDETGEILSQALITHNKDLVNPIIQSKYSKGAA